jgi:hypothetical protein
MRYFRSPEATYEAVRLSLDAEWGLPAHGQRSCYSPSDYAPRNTDGLLMLAVDDAFCEYVAVAAMLPQLLASGAVDEIDAATYWGSMPPSPPLY